MKSVTQVQCPSDSTVNSSGDLVSSRPAAQNGVRCPVSSNEMVVFDREKT